MAPPSTSSALECKKGFEASSHIAVSSHLGQAQQATAAPRIQDRTEDDCTVVAVLQLREQEPEKCNEVLLRPALCHDNGVEQRPAVDDAARVATQPLEVAEGEVRQRATARRAKRQRKRARSLARRQGKRRSFWKKLSQGCWQTATAAVEGQGPQGCICSGERRGRSPTARPLGIQCSQRQSGRTPRSPATCTSCSCPRQRRHYGSSGSSSGSSSCAGNPPRPGRMCSAGETPSCRHRRVSLRATDCGPEDRRIAGGTGDVDLKLHPTALDSSCHRWALINWPW